MHSINLHTELQCRNVDLLAAAHTHKYHTTISIISNVKAHEHRKWANKFCRCQKAFSKGGEKRQSLYRIRAKVTVFRKWTITLSQSSNHFGIIRHTKLVEMCSNKQFMCFGRCCRKFRFPNELTEAFETLNNCALVNSWAQCFFWISIFLEFSYEWHKTEGALLSYRALEASRIKLGVLLQYTHIYSSTQIH